MKKILSLLLVLAMLTPCFAVSSEVSAEKHNFWQEADIVFFQTLPFAAFWGHFLDQQISGSLAISSAPHWNAIVGFAVLVSAVNAKLYAGKVSVDNLR